VLITFGDAADGDAADAEDDVDDGADDDDEVGALAGWSVWTEHAIKSRAVVEALVTATTAVCRKRVTPAASDLAIFAFDGA
jgi:hypothetical protein